MKLTEYLKDISMLLANSSPQFFCRLTMPSVGKCLLIMTFLYGFILKKMLISFMWNIDLSVTSEHLSIFLEFYRFFERNDSPSIIHLLSIITVKFVDLRVEICQLFSCSMQNIKHVLFNFNWLFLLKIIWDIQKEIYFKQVVPFGNFFVFLPYALCESFSCS